MENKALKTQKSLFLKLTEALKKELSLEKGKEKIIRIKFQKSGGDWNLEELKVQDPEEDLTRELSEAKRELKAAKKRLKAAEQQLVKQEKLASLGLLTAGIAHEIKNPLNFITNFSDLSVEYLVEIEELLQDHKHLNEIKDAFALIQDIKTNLGKIHDHGHRAEGIVRSMLLHSRGGNGHYDPVDLNALLKEYVNLAFHGMRANKNPINVEINLDLDPNLGKVTVNAESFSRVILNLCKNAFDAMREKAGYPGAPDDYRPKLKVSSFTENKKAVITVEDNGPGVPDELKNKILTPFFTTKKGAEGTGLGLSISKEILQEHKALLSIDSKEGEFTRFRIELSRKL